MAGTQTALLAGHRGTVVAAAYAPNGKSLVTVSDDGTARLWDTQIEQQLDAVVRVPGAVAARLGGGRIHTARAGHGGPVSLAPNGAIARSDGRLTSAAGSRLTAPSSVSALFFDGTRLAAVTHHGDLHVWDATRRKLLDRALIEPGAVRVGLSPDRHTIVTGDSDGTVRLWTTRGRLLHVLRTHTQPITDARFDPTGRLLVTASAGSAHNLAVWDARTGSLLHTLVGHFGTVTAASFSPDGRWILTAGPIAAAIWAADSGQLLFYLHGPTTLLTDAEWAPTGYQAITAERDGVIRTYTCVLCQPLNRLETLGNTRLAASRRAQEN
jgi:WD40 repeat protein